MDILFLSPGYPAEMPLFVRGLADVGARVWGVGDQAKEALPEEARKALAAYLPVKDLWDEEATIASVLNWLGGRKPDKVECLWEPGMILAAKLRERLGVAGMTVAQTIPLRDKSVMKARLEAAGVRVPRHGRATNEAELRAHAARIGFPLIVKPVAGAGSDDTYEVRDDRELDAVLAKTRHVPEVVVEEYIEGEEHTYDTVCAGGEVLFENVGWYRPKPLVAKLNHWISAQAACLKDIDADAPRKGRELGRKAMAALGVVDGFTHMEWFLTAKGEAVFGEIGGRPPGSRLVHVMNYSCDADLFRAWAEATVRGRLSRPIAKKYNAVVVFKRAHGPGGRIRAHEGLDRLLARHGEHVANLELTPVGGARADWKKSQVGDGWIVVRHPDLSRALELADEFGSELRIVAG